MEKGAHAQEEWQDGGKNEKVLTVLPRGGGKRHLPGWTGQTGLTDRLDRSHLECSRT